MATDSLNSAKIDILFHEYNNLSQNILSRYQFQYQSTWAYGAVLAGLFTAWVSNSGKSLTLFARCIDAQCVVMYGAIAMTVAYVAIQIWIDYDVWKAASQLRTLESKINHLVGVPLLSWETKFGGGGKFWKFIYRWFPCCK